MADKYPFLSDDWFDAVLALIEKHGNDAPAHQNMRMNLVVTDTPFQGSQSQRIVFSSGTGELGVENRGLNRWGMHFAAGGPGPGRDTGPHVAHEPEGVRNVQLFALMNWGCGAVEAHRATQRR